MKKVLIIAYYFPPCTEVGSLRPFGLAKYLPKYGWGPIILTPRLSGKPPEGIKIIETDYKDIIGNIKSNIALDPVKGMHEQLGIKVTKNYQYPTIKSKAIKFMREAITFPDTKKGWHKFALQSAFKLLDTEKIDIIISTSPPEISHVIASKLKQKYKIPWIADLRDLWTQDHFYNKFGSIKYFERRLELKTFSDADVLVAVTQRFADELKTLHKDKQVICITNGYDADDYSTISTKLTNKFTITYTGSLYNGKMDPSLLFEAVSMLINDNKINKDLVEIRIYSHEEDWLLNDINKYGLEGIVSCYGFLPREVVLEKQKESQLLLLMCDKSREIIYYPAKVFEYFGAGRPIIAMGGQGGIVKELLDKTNSGKFAISDDNLRDILLEYYREFIKYGEVRCHSNNNIDNYNYRFITEKYSMILNSLM